MGKKILTMALALASFCAVSQTRPGSLRGKVTNAETGEGVPFANIVIKDQGGATITGGSTDFDGKYNINPVQAGTYNITASEITLASSTLQGVQVSPNTPTVLDFKLGAGNNELDEVVVEYVEPLINKGGSTVKTFNAEDVVNMAVRDVSAVATQAAGAVSTGDGTSIRGAREEGTVYFIDGVKVRGSNNLPQAAIAQTQVITGGLPAQYGDALGGIISVTTRGPSSEVFGTAEILTSTPFDFKLFSDRPVDPQRYNLGAFTIGGPLGWRDDNDNPRLGFLFSTEFLYVAEPNPGVVPYTSLEDGLYEDLKENPIVVDSNSTGGYVNRAELINNSQLVDVYRRPNSYSSSLRFNGSLQIKTSRLTNVTVGGRWNYSDDKSASFANHIFNPDNNLDRIDNDWSTYVRFQQTFDNDPDSKSLIKNAFYNIQLDFTSENTQISNQDFEDDFFRYGYIGKFDVQRTPNFQRGTDDTTGITAFRFSGNRDTAVTFTPGDDNPVLANYMSRYYEAAQDNPFVDAATDNFVVLQSSVTPPVNGQNPLSVYGNLWGNVGAVQDFRSLGVGGANYFKERNNQFRVTASTNFDIGDHSLILGFEYEQRSDRGYALNATNLWNRARLLQNRPNTELDLDNPILVFDDNGAFQDTILYNFNYNATDASEFAENIRRELGLDPFSTEQINIDNLDPSRLNINMFSPDEVIVPDGSQGVSYYGYDYTGELTTRNSSISDFFLERDENDRFTRPVAPFEPIYIAGYIQDQFTFNDLTFNVGVRVDRFDLNQQVLKDPYILYPFYSVGDLSASPLGGEGLQIPTNIQEDFAVYVNSYDYTSQDLQIVGYRDGDVFYDADGEVLTDPSVLSDLAGGGIKPFTLQTPDERAAEQGEGGRFIPQESFEDYTPQTVFMPRIAFNFPITDEALFIFHYDKLAQRPTTNISRFDPFAYLDLLNSDASGVVNNPNLKPQQTTEYEAGFKQALTENSALKISAFYRELRDLLQTVSYTQAYPIIYVAYGNRDFGTVKGFSLEYEMRRTRRFKLDANYTLQFANGTGSSTTTGLNLARSGQPNLRTTLPLSFDNRHQILVRADYRYGTGRRYDGPVWWDKNFLEGFGVNITMNALSGSPYTKRNAPFPVTATNPSSFALVEGQINGSRLPWQLTFDARINKVFGLKKEDHSLEVYLQILNLFNQQNVTSVYAYTGTVDDDGYLSSAGAQSVIENQVSPTAYVDLYNRNMVNPFRYSLPRRMRLGVAFNF